jgi:phage terminase small subunit
MARKPASHFEVVPIEQALPLIEPPAHLSGAEKALFHSIVQQSAAQNFTRNDAELLAAYVQACHLVAQSYASAMEKPDYVRDWERACRVMVTLATKLRLTPSARVDPRSLTRQLTGRSYANFPDLERIEQAREGTGPLRDWKARG